MVEKDLQQRHQCDSLRFRLRVPGSPGKAQPGFGPYMSPNDQERLPRRYDEFRFFTGLRPTEQIALLVTDYDARRAVLSVTKARRPAARQRPHQDAGGSRR
jgi:hypothetical protein